MTAHNNILRVSALLVPAVLVLAGCGRAQPSAGAPPAPEVAVITLVPRTVSITDELPGRTTAYRVAEVRPQVSGIVQKRLFSEGGEVKAGEQLLQIDPATYRAALSSAQAALKRAEARLVSAKLLEERYAPLIEANAVSKQDYDDAVAARAQAEADVAAARAQVEAAEINLAYTKVLSPISGRIGRALVTEGALVTKEQTQPLALIQQLDPIYVDITQSSTEMLRLQRQLADGVLQRDAANQAEVSLTLEDGTVYPEKGKLQFSEVSVDPSTGAVVLRAIFPNPRRELLPGMFVRAQLTQGVRHDALLVPQRGVTRNQKGEATVMVVGDDNKVVERVVRADRVIGGDWLITEGLAPQERVVVDGLQKIRPGVEVRAVAAVEKGASPGSERSPAGTDARPAQASDAQPKSAPAQVTGASGTSSSSAKGAEAPGGAQRDALASEVARR
ncbi:MAG: efflux RND transporter periplasmic adaptor subunit [Steroidobacteraceae bacterium]|nr:efflux RND transporter periplasmic adaptor subunit [Steroidobacteraceae bacterium]